MFEILTGLVFIAWICVISIRGKDDTYKADEEVDYPSLDDPQFEKKVKAYFKQQHIMNKFEHL